MGTSAGIWKRIKNGIGNALNWVGDKIQKVADTGILKLIPKGLGKPINRVVEKIGTTVEQLGNLTNGNMTGQEFGNYMLDEYKGSFLGTPIYLAQKVHNYTTENKNKDASTRAQAAWDMTKDVVSDMWNYTKEFFS